MPFQIVRNDITKMHVDAIVNAANTSLLGGGGVDGCIHRAAGPGLLKECRTLGSCETGSAKITKGYRLPAKYVIHAVGPRWRGGDHGEREKLYSCYSTSLKIAKEYGCGSIAFPLISSGIYGYPKDQALKVATDAISDFLTDNEMQVYLVIFAKDVFHIAKGLYDDIQSYIDDVYTAPYERAERMRPVFNAAELDRQEYEDQNQDLQAPDAGVTGRETLEDALGQIDESFSEMLLRKIDESGLSDAACYKKANVDRKLFSKIRSNKNYHPSKSTVLAFAIALHLPVDEINDMLMKAGFALSHSSKFDIIVEYFIKHGNYNIYEINEALFAFDQNLIGNM